MEFQIDSGHFKNKHGDYLDVELNNEEKYISIKTVTTGEYAFESVQEIDELCLYLKQLLRGVCGVNTQEIDMRIYGAGC